MTRPQILKGVALALACCGLLMPPGIAQAASPLTAARTKAPRLTDIALKKGGTLTGQVVNPQGKGIDGAIVSLQQRGKEAARAVTNGEGFFSMTGLKGGTYEIVSGQGRGAARLWAPETSPPKAKSHALIVSGKPTVRGQYAGGIDAITLTTLGTGIAGVTLGAINLSKNNDIEDNIDELEEKVDMAINSAN